MVGTLSLVGSSGCTEAAILAAVFALLLLPSQRRGGPLAAAAPGAEWGRDLGEREGRPPAGSTGPAGPVGHVTYR